MRDVYNVGCELIEQHAVSRGEKAAILFGRETITYARLRDEINRFGNVLKELGMRPGERILIALPDCPQCVYAFLGSIKFGAWPVLVSPQLAGGTYEFMLDDSQATAILTGGESTAAGVRTKYLRHVMDVGDESFRERWNGASAELDPHPSRRDDIAFMLYSSGSTGNPKGVPHCHGDIPYTVDAYARRVLDLSAEDVCFSGSKLSFAYGLGNSLSFPLGVGATVVLYPGKSTAPDVFQVISNHRPTLFFGVPTLYNMMLKTLDDKLSLDSLRLCVSAGEALPSAIYQEWKKLTGLDIIDGIGSTEALHIFISNRPGRVCPGTTGFLVPPYEAKIVGDSGAPVLPGEPGHLLIRGESTAPCYWNRPEKTSETMLEDGWLKTGDIYVCERDCFTYLGRSDDMFKVGGQWVSPSQVEDVLREHPAVSECALTWRTIEGLVLPLAHVVPAPGIKGDPKLFRELRAHVLQRLPEHMCPVQVNFCEELPRTETGKLQRFRLRNG